MVRFYRFWLFYDPGDDLAMNLDCSAVGVLKVGCSVTAADKYNQLNLIRVNWGDGSVSRPTVNQTNYFYNPTHTYANAGTYTISLTEGTTRGYSRTITQTISFSGASALPPVASIQCTTNNLLLNCNGITSFDPSGSALTYTFSYGDGTSETNNTGIVTHAYADSGLYDVSLTVTNANGISSTTMMAVMPGKTENVPPIAKLNCTSSAPKTSKCNFTGSSDADGSIVLYTLTYDDGTSDLATDASSIEYHIFQTAGEHTITLSVVDNDGGESSISKTIVTNENQNPIADFTCYQAMAQSLSCGSTSSDPDSGDTITNYEWKVSYNNEIEYTARGILQVGLNNTFSHAGDVEVSLSVRDSFGGSSSVTKIINLPENQAPIANINCYPINGTTYQCDSNAQDPDGQVVDQTWTIEGQQIKGSSIQYNFTNGGTKKIYLNLIDNLRLSSNFESTTDVKLPGATPYCFEISAMLYECRAGEVTSLDEEDPILSYEYYIDDSEILRGREIQYEFSVFGKHKIELRIKTVSNKMSIYNLEIVIDQKYLQPRPEFIEDVLLSNRVHFDGSLSEDTGRSVTKYEWDFGDGEKLTSTSPINTHQYNSNGWFDVKLKVTDQLGATAEIDNPVYVYDPEVEAPGDEGLVSIEGIDSDNDGIRDDVQRWINQNSFESLAAKNAFRELAIVYKNQRINSENINVLEGLEDQKKLIETCVNSEIIGEYNITKSVEFELMYLNSNERMTTFSKVKENLSGYLPKTFIVTDNDPCAKWR